MDDGARMDSDRGYRDVEGDPLAFECSRSTAATRVVDLVQGLRRSVGDGRLRVQKGGSVGVVFRRLRWHGVPQGRPCQRLARCSFTQHQECAGSYLSRCIGAIMRGFVMATASPGVMLLLAWT